MAREIVVIAPQLNAHPEWAAQGLSNVHDFNAVDAGFNRWVPHNTPFTVTLVGSGNAWRTELAKGVLLPGNAFTAKWAGITWNPPKPAVPAKKEG